MKKKKYWYWFFTILGVLLIAFALLIWPFNLLGWIKCKSVKEVSAYTSADMASAYDNGYKAGLKERACCDSFQYYKGLYERCAGIKRNAVTKNVAPPAGKGDAKKANKPETQSPNAPETAKSFTDDARYNVNNYTPIFQGDYGCSFVKDGDYGYLTYFVSNEYYKKYYDKGYVPTINGLPFTPDVDGFYKVVTDIKLTGENIENKWYQWAMYIGDFKGTGFSYPMYDPNEVLKPTIMKVRNKLNGPITDKDLAGIGTYVPDVQKGYIRPNGQPSDDYWGWEFNMPVYYKKVTEPSRK